ncbi:hypothetical protein OUY22_02505 [Nonomuraea sp. MCN248]|uniref:Uncharacterized protein n=1 Tax=Nonomuraea corallina TaxID=2989783 RepID=A0ABT4S500_9ACTN|nr:hypothetical protein [Nonomuraea corallina]MDA0632274.1 hypothetical protein [Nonomuraea corallina]
MTDDRTAFIHGLIHLAVFLQANPDAPAPRRAVVHYFARDADDDQMRAQIDAIAGLLGSTADQDSGHYVTSVCFGPVEYRAVAILSDARARHAAHDSYRGCITPDTH